MSFKAIITDTFRISKYPDSLVPVLNNVEGTPVAGDVIQIGGRSGKVVAVNDGGIKDRSCLTGQKTPRWGALLANFGSCDTHGLLNNEIVGESDTDVL